MKRLTGAMVLLMLLGAVAMAVPVDLGLPANQWVNIDGNGLFDQTPQPDPSDPLAPAAPGTEFFGIGTISGVALLYPPNTELWDPDDVTPGTPDDFEMTFTFWDAIVATSSVRQSVNGLGETVLTYDLTYNDGARVMLVQDTTADYNTLGGPGLFDLQDGEYPTVYTLEDAGYDSDGLPDGTSPKAVTDDAGEEVFLDMLLSNCYSTLTYNSTWGWHGGTFIANTLEVIGGSGAPQFQQFGGGDAFILSILPVGNWLYAADIDIQLQAVPAPTALISLMTGLVCLGGFRFRRWGRAA